MSVALPPGPVMIGVEGLALTDADRRRLVDPKVGAVILFARNFASREQLAALTAEIHALRDPPLPIAVDHEGGRVQRFRDGFTAVPPMRLLGARHDTDPAGAVAEAEQWGRTIARELKSVGVDFSFAPVLDLDHGHSTIIGDRAFHRDPAATTALATALVNGLRAEGMASVGKHFPGHGFVAADSHLALPSDTRDFGTIEGDDLVPFFALIAGGLLDGIMPAHVVYPDVDEDPAGYSTFWLQGVLRDSLGFEGLIFSDDLEMAGAQGKGDIVARADAAIAAGCDMVLVCNDFAQMDALLAGWSPTPEAVLVLRIKPFRSAA